MSTPTFAEDRQVSTLGLRAIFEEHARCSVGRRGGRRRDDSMGLKQSYRMDDKGRLIETIGAD